MSGVRAYRLFDATVLRKQALSPSLCRLTFGGAAGMKTCAADQRIKMFFPDVRGAAPTLPHDGWLAAYNAMDPATRPPRRTYTIRALRAEAGEMDIDFVLHGATGPASRWAIAAKPGDTLQIVAPDGGFDGDPGGYEWRPPAHLERLLLIADETALPAIAGILEDLAQSEAPPRTAAFIEVPAEGDCIALPSWRGLDLHWRPREAQNIAPGMFMIAAAQRAFVPAPRAHGVAVELPDIDVEKDILWDVPRPSASSFYAWVAGEAAAVKTIRHILIKERGLERESANLMGYWRVGKALE